MNPRLFSATPELEPPTSSLRDKAALFCESTPHRTGMYGKRNWGGLLHRLCSYQGKLKPSIAHFLVWWFTEPGWRVLDPMAGVGTIPLEARRQGRVAIANDLSPLAGTVCRAKLLQIDPPSIEHVLRKLEEAIATDAPPPTDIEFGLNGPIRLYFHERTMREIVIARRFLADSPVTAETDVVRTCLLHILHGNRPYALSRRSHPVTPFAPTGPNEYRPLLPRLRKRVSEVIPELVQLQETSQPSEVHEDDFRNLKIDLVDAVITSPPFADSLRFWSSNWMRLWFAGWEPEDFRTEPRRYLETEQKNSFTVYKDFAEATSRVMKPGALLIMHLGETRRVNMTDAISPLLDPFFEIAFLGRESVLDTESHGLTDKGSTLAHQYLFAYRR